jgi:hypothetical protein
MTSYEFPVTTFSSGDTSISISSSNPFAGASNSTGASAMFASYTGESNLQSNTIYSGPGGTTMTTDSNGHVVTVNGALPTDTPTVIRLNAFMTATIPAGMSITADLSEPGQVRYDFSEPIVVSVPLLPNPTIDSITVHSDGMYLSYSGTNGYFGMVDSGIKQAVNTDFRIGVVTRNLVNNIDTLTYLFGKPVPITKSGKGGTF